MNDDERDEMDREMRARLDELFYDRRVIVWARTACAALPDEAKSWDQRGGYWLCVFKDEHPAVQPSAFKHFVGDEYLVHGLAFALETEADLAGWAWERMIRDFFGLSAIERDPGVLTPTFVRAEWFPDAREPARAVNA